MRILARNGVAAEVTGPTKGRYSLYRKMLRTHPTLEQITDRVGLRVAVDAVPTCYQVLGLLHSHFCPIPGTFDDYIGRREAPAHLLPTVWVPPPPFCT